ncbi:MAG: restriction endonuclease subunit S [Verrucomicrobiales bacterium]|jgi:type I restriction enzyme S subunit|nr:restriction endonuclease subunit S [Verrucomicrobiales bacterium]
MIDFPLGTIPEHWEATTLGEICRRGGGGIQTGPFGSQLHASDYVPDGIPSIMPVNIGENRILRNGIACITEEDAERLAQHRVKEGDIIYSRRGDVERRALICKNEAGWLCGTGCLKVRLGFGVVDPSFASYQLGHPAVRQWIVRHAVGATMPNLNTGIMNAVPFALPPLPEQKAIAQILGTLDDKIELNRRMNATLERMARALFKNYFPYSIMDKLPEGWTVFPLSKKIEILSGGTPQTTEPLYWGGDIFWYSVKDAPVDADIWVIQTEKTITQKGIDNSATKILPENTTIISARGTVGKLALTGIPMAINQSCYGIRGINGYGQYFTYFRLQEAVSDLQQRTHGTVFDTITRQTFETLDCVFPPQKLAQTFDKTVKPLLNKIRSNLFESYILAIIRDIVLSQLLNRKLHNLIDEE